MRLIGKAMAFGYRLVGKDRYDDFRLERVYGVPFIVTPSVFNPKVPRTGEFLASQIDSRLVARDWDVLDMGTGQASARCLPPSTRDASWRWTSTPRRFAAPASMRS